MSDIQDKTSEQKKTDSGERTYQFALRVIKFTENLNNMSTCKISFKLKNQIFENSFNF